MFVELAGAYLLKIYCLIVRFLSVAISNIIDVCESIDFDALKTVDKI